MEDKWKDDLVGLLKFLEKSHQNSVKIREFRRSLESCNVKKAAKILPQLLEIYNKCKDHLDMYFDSWVTEQSFILKLGLKTITLSPGKDKEGYGQYVRWVFSSFDPTLNNGNPNNIIRMKNGLPVSNKQLKMAMKKI